MVDRVSALWIVTILLVTLLAGLAFAHVLEYAAKVQYDAQLYVQLQKTLYVQWGPPHIGGFLEPIAILSTGLLAFGVRSDRVGLGLTLAALVALLTAFPVVFFLWVAPANAFFATANLSAIDASWTLARADWEMGHAIRFGLQSTAALLLLAGLARRSAFGGCPAPRAT